MDPVRPHGTGREVDADAPRLEHRRPEDMPFPDAAQADPLADGRDPKTKRVRTREAAQALARLPRRKHVLPAPIASSPDFEPHYRRRLKWLDERRAELLAVGRGKLSYGVMARLNHAAWLFAAAEYAAAKAAKEGRLELLTTSADLAARADRMDWSAYHMAIREAKVRTEAEKDDASNNPLKLLPKGGPR